MTFRSNFAIRATRLIVLMLMCGCAQSALAQQLSTRFSCSEMREEDNQKALYADNGEIRLDGNRIETFHWESSLLRRTHGFECSIDETDGLQAEARGESWRISLTNARAARTRRGYNFEHGFNCTIRLERNGDTLQVKPTCPALCGSRSNFSELSVEGKTGKGRYEE